MKLKVMAAALFFIEALTVAPLPATESPDDCYVEMSGTIEQQSAADESANSACPPPFVTSREEEKSQAAPVSAPAHGEFPGKSSWWADLSYRLGFGSDPDPGETVQPAMKMPDPEADYVIGPGDQLGIAVWRDENLTRIVVVLPDGKINFPLVGEIVAGGKTVAKLKAELEEKLTRFVAVPGLTVEVKQSNSMLIYIIGKVNVPGRQMLLANTNVLQAIAMAGGLNTFADKRKIKIFRQEGGKTIYFPFDLWEVSEGKHLETNIELKRGDVIIVP